jgi:hypothetical protein
MSTLRASLTTGSHVGVKVSTYEQRRIQLDDAARTPE